MASNTSANTCVLDAEDASFEEVVLPHLDTAYRLARWLTQNEHDAEDAVQEASLRALRYFRTFSGGNGRAWFLRIVRNTCAGQRGAGGHAPADEFDEERHGSDRPGSDPESLLLQTADVRLIDLAMRNVSDRFRELLVLREFEGLSYQEMSEAIGIPIGTVMSGLSRARQAFRQALNDAMKQYGDSTVEASAIPAAQPSGRKAKEKVKSMTKTTAVLLAVLGMARLADAQDGGFLARFEGGIGVIPAQNGAGLANPDGTLPNVRLNVVRGVNPGAGPWRIAELSADIRRDGRIKVKGNLLLASGNSIGTNANQTVFATLICEAAAPFVEHNSSFSVPLEANGDFRIDDTLSTVPSECPSPVLLIRNAGGVWFAAGVLKQEGK